MWPKAKGTNNINGETNKGYTKGKHPQESQGIKGQKANYRERAKINFAYFCFAEH